MLILDDKSKAAAGIERVREVQNSVQFFMAVNCFGKISHCKFRLQRRTTIVDNHCNPARIAKPDESFSARDLFVSVTQSLIKPLMQFHTYESRPGHARLILF